MKIMTILRSLAFSPLSRILSHFPGFNFRIGAMKPVADFYAVCYALV